MRPSRQRCWCELAKFPSKLLRCMNQFVALGGKSRRCDNFGSYAWYKRRGERVDFCLRLTHFRPRLCGSIALQQLPEPCVL